jgi:hypothetical protein
MKSNKSRILFAVALLLSAIAACTKMTNTNYHAGTTPVLSSSVTTIAPAPADSLSTAVVFSWTNPKYDSPYPAPVVYTIQIDSSGHNFAAPATFTVSGAMTDSMTAQQINNLVLGMGGAFGVPFSIEVRMYSAYGNYNEQLFSNTLTIPVTPYKTPPKVVPPTSSLYLVGAATQGGWTAPVPVPTQVFEKVDSVDYGGVFSLIGGQQFLVLPQNDGTFTNKLASNDATETGTGGTFGYNDNNNFTGPVTSGWYSIWLNFQTGTFTITPYSGFVPDSLVIVGDATPGGWTAPVPAPSQVLTQTNSSQFSLQLAFVAGGQYLLLPTNSGSFTNKYAVGSSNDTASAGTFGYNPNGANSAYNTNFTGPAAAGTYTITVDFLKWTYTVK